ncbi:MAG: biopolymer transporter ExbD [Deltaproteobacteria bacterium]|nr:biopolymer transporter ExbD [Deltaproteobacteria bacterium]
MLSAHQVRNKQRAAVRRREDDVEEDEITSGELNLVPYLDIVTNLMLFLLASVTAIVILGQINTTLPDKGQSASTADPQTKPEDVPLKMVVSITKDKIILWSISGLEGTLKDPKITVARTGRQGEKCDGGYMCESNVCETQTRTCTAPDPKATIVPVFDYRTLNDALFKIARDRYLGKHRSLATYQAILMADGSIPYGTIISVMNAMRCKLPAVGTGTNGCYLPSAELKPTDKPIVDADMVYDTARAEYNPDKFALFHDILFSTGFE